MAQKGTRAKPGQVHGHGCTRCRRYYDDTCADPKENVVCRFCTTGQERPLWLRDRDPIECCKTNYRELSNDDVDRFKLSRGCKWYICTICRRPIPYHPKLVGVIR